MRKDYSSVISGFCCDVDEMCTFLGYYTAFNANPVPAFQDNVLVPLSRVRKFKKVKRSKKTWTS